MKHTREALMPFFYFEESQRQALGYKYPKKCVALEEKRMNFCLFMAGSTTKCCNFADEIKITICN